MRSLGPRRLILAAGLAAVTAVAVAGCSAGQVAETSVKRPSNQGVNAENSNNTVAIRNLAVTYNGPEGYPAGAAAPLEVSLFNQTTQPITVLVSSRQPDAALGKDVIYGTNVVLTGGAQPSSPSTAIPEPSGSRGPAVPETSNGPSGSVETPSAAPSAASPSPSGSAGQSARPARIVLSPLGNTSFLSGDAESLQLQGLSAQLRPGMSVNLVFEFSNGAAPLTVQAPVGVPLSPAPRESPNPSENHED